MKPVGGTVYVQIDGRQVAAKGNWTFNIGNPKQEQQQHGITSMWQPSKLEGVITDVEEEDMDALTQLQGATLTLELQNGKTWVMREGSFTGDGDATTEAGEIAVTFESRHKLEKV